MPQDKYGQMSSPSPLDRDDYFLLLEREADTAGLPSKEGQTTTIAVATPDSEADEE